MRDATVLGVGSMIGAGIFALLGEAGAIAGSAVWISFLIGGVVAGLLGYVCSKLGMRYPSSGGLITYLVEGFGPGRLVGVTSWLGYISAVVVVTAMVAVSFGGYAVSLFVGDDGWSGWDNVFITALLVVMCALNMVGAKVVAAAQAAIVTGVLAVFGVFIFVTVPKIDTSLLAFDTYPSASKIIASVALTFFAFLGFNVITFTAGDLKNPRRDLPRAMALSLGITTARLRAHRDRRVRDAHGDRGDRLRRDGHRRGRPAVARGRRVHDHGGGGAARDRRLHERDAVRVRQPHRDARGVALLPGVLRRRVPARHGTPASSSRRRSSS